MPLDLCLASWTFRPVGRYQAAAQASVTACFNRELNACTALLCGSGTSLVMRPRGICSFQSLICRITVLSGIWYVASLGMIATPIPCWTACLMISRLPQACRGYVVVYQHSQKAALFALLPEILAPQEGTKARGEQLANGTCGNNER
jgi:hypothetical protein